MSRYVEFVIRGDDRDLKGYIAGYLSATGAVRVHYADEAGLEIHRLGERIKHHGEVQHVIVTSEHGARIREAISAAGPRYDFAIKDERAIDEGMFRFEFDTPSRDVAARLKDLLTRLPAGTKLSEYVPTEKTRTDGSGAELYTPSHDYRFEGRGEIRGDLFAVIEARRSLLAIDFTRCDEIKIES